MLQLRERRNVVAMAVHILGFRRHPTPFLEGPWAFFRGRDPRRFIATHQNLVVAALGIESVPFHIAEATVLSKCAVNQCGCVSKFEANVGICS